jgi:hypothetical protein
VGLDLYKSVAFDRKAFCDARHISRRLYLAQVAGGKSMDFKLFSRLFTPAPGF